MGDTVNDSFEPLEGTCIESCGKRVIPFFVSVAMCLGKMGSGHICTLQYLTLNNQHAVRHDHARSTVTRRMFLGYVT